MLDGATRQVRLEHNNLVDDIEVIRAALYTLATNFNAVLTKLDADAGVTDTNYNSLQAVTRTTYDAAGDMTAAKVADQDGVTT
jgi:hypothetical protein